MWYLLCLRGMQKCSVTNRNYCIINSRDTAMTRLILLLVKLRYDVFDAKIARKFSQNKSFWSEFHHKHFIGQTENCRYNKQTSYYSTNTESRIATITEKRWTHEPSRAHTKQSDIHEDSVVADMGRTSARRFVCLSRKMTGSACLKTVSHRLPSNPCNLI
jgi:hypothetical protein